ncbi:serine hydrolase domain-containing protein [Yeosuana marina]|uniref:serine hydrolase domain-containing protein n=1 Tax=Yeosuana marina TaxID=1565536 RepID=UPI0030C7D293
MTKNDNVIYNNNFGLADYQNNRHFSDKTTFKIGEISELVTANIIKNMEVNEKLKLSDKVSKYITNVKSDLTISDILNKKNKLDVHSSNTGEKSDIDYHTLGELIEKVSGKSYQENIEEYSNDLKLENTYFKKIDSTIPVGYLYSNYRGNGDELHKSPSSDLNITFSNGLKSTANDLIKIINSNNELDIYGYLENDALVIQYKIFPKIKQKLLF